MNEDQLRELWFRLAGRQPGLWTLRQYTRTEIKTRPTLLVYDTLSGIGELPEDLPAWLFQKLTGYDREKLLAIFSNINSRLMVAGLSNPAFHAKLENDLLTSTQRERLQAERRTRGADLSVVFTRRSLLLLIKLTMGVDRQAPGDRDFDERLTGELVLAANELFEHEMEPDDDALIVDAISNWELYNAGDLPMSIARFDWLISHFLNSQKPEIATARDKLSLGPTPFDGLTLAQYRALLFLTYTLIEKGVKRADAPIIELKPPIPDYIGGASLVWAFFQQRSVRISGFEDPRDGGRWTENELERLLRDLRFLHDITWLRQRPFVLLDDGRYLSPDFELAVERMTTGLYWTVFDQLDDRLKELFSITWGEVFEDYVISMLENFYPSMGSLSKILSTNVPFSEGNIRGEIDAVLDFGDHLIVIEAKSSLLPVHIRAARDAAVFGRWVDSRLVRTSEGRKKALIQLSDACSVLASGMILPGASPCRIYPVFLTDEISFEAFGANRYLNKRFAPLLSSELDAVIRPLTVMSTGEFEKLLPCLGAGLFTMKEIFERRFDGQEVGWMSVGQTIYNRLLEDGKLNVVKPNPVLSARFVAFMDELKAYLPKTDVQ